MENSSRETKNWLALMVAVFIVVASVGVIKPASANPTCILNCAQCVQLYGDFFDGHSCAQVCMEARARLFESHIVDCADPTNIARFIRTK